MSTKKEQVLKYTRTWVTNRHIDFFRFLMLGYEPKEVNPTAIVNLLLRLRYRIAEVEHRRIKVAVFEERATYKQKVLYFLLEDAKAEAIAFNKNLTANIENIYRYHYELGTPFQAILFHIYCFIKFGIKTKSQDHEFGELLNYLLTQNTDLRQTLLEKDEYFQTSTKKQSKFNSNKSKEKWLDRAAIYGHKIEKRKIVLFKDMPKK